MKKIFNLEKETRPSKGYDQVPTMIRDKTVALSFEILKDEIPLWIRLNTLENYGAVIDFQ